MGLDLDGAGLVRPTVVEESKCEKMKTNESVKRKEHIKLKQVVSADSKTFFLSTRQRIDRFIISFILSTKSVKSEKKIVVAGVRTHVRREASSGRRAELPPETAVEKKRSTTQSRN
jgi:hypothetical protein